MPIDPRIAATVSIQSRKGVYALLLGSGVSRAAEIPTGWEVVKELIHRVAALAGEGPPADAAAWFERHTGEPVTYSSILALLGKTQADRAHILRGFFEPTEEEREQGLKMPTRAHHAIARLVRAGHIKVIITTNFDRLLEQALADAGVQPTVLSTAASFENAPPLQHEDCTILKIHGDYLGLQTRNTIDELTEYPVSTADVLRRVFCEHGLLVCGWSGEWDHALATLMMGTTTRYSTYWLARGDLGEAARGIVDHRRADLIRIESADEAFEDLEGKVLALEDGRASPPISAEVAFNAAKRYLSEQRFDVRLESMVTHETEKVLASLHGPGFDLGEPTPDSDSIRERWERALATSEILRAILMAGCHWGEERHRRIWKQCLQGLMRPPRARMQFPDWEVAWHLPSALSFYASGIGAVAAEQYGTLQSLFDGCWVRADGQRKLLLEFGLAGNYRRVAQAVNNLKYFAANQLFHECLQKTPGPVITSAGRFTEQFDRFECLAGMAFFDLNQDEATRFHEQNPGYVPDARFFMIDRDPAFPPAVFAEEIRIDGTAWLPVAQGMFGGSVERAQAALAAVTAQRGSKFP